MRIKTIEYENFNHYKAPVTLIATTRCKRNCPECHNQHLKDLPNIEIDETVVINNILMNGVSQGICFAGLDSFDSLKDYLDFLKELSNLRFNKPIILYTGYEEKTFNGEGRINVLKTLFPNLKFIVKYGEYMKDKPKIFDPILGIELASDNQYSVRYYNEDNRDE